MGDEYTVKNLSSMSADAFYYIAFYICDENHVIRNTVVVGDTDEQTGKITLYIGSGSVAVAASHSVMAYAAAASSDSTETLITAYTYDANGNRKSVENANGTVTCYRYNKANLVTELYHIRNGAVISAYLYTYYCDGNVHTVTEYDAADEVAVPSGIAVPNQIPDPWVTPDPDPEPDPDVDSYEVYSVGGYTAESQSEAAGCGKQTTYTYDGLGRLLTETTAEDGETKIISYTYDSRGNRATMTENGIETTYTYDANNRLTGEQTGLNVKTFSYDANGNQLVAQYNFNFAGAYTYNLFGRQVSYTPDNVGYTYYTYRADGLRHSVGGTVHVWDGTDITADVDGSTVTVYFRGNGLIYAETGGEKTYYHQNAHGDVILLTDEMGDILRSYEYDAFGREWGALDTDNNPFRYCGEYFDKQTETVYLRARYYDSAYGRFTQQDGWEYANFGDPLSLNLYTYCWNNPVLYADYTGAFPLLACVLTAMFVSTAVYKLNQFSHNYEHNSKTYTGSGYIYGQKSTEGVKDCRLGFQKMSENGCEAIAIYNAMIALGETQKLADVVDYCEDSMWLLGYFGTHWEAIPEYFKDHGMYVEIADSVENYQTVLKENGYGVFTFWNKEGDITEGIHTVFIEYVSDEQILVYNYYSSDVEPRPFENISDLIQRDNAGAIQFVGVSNRRLPPKDVTPNNPNKYVIAV